ncbi:MAG: ATP-dependent metallopeptidase FtsH/Yme1/Tma family protein, partial [Phycisphaerae bacterium]
MADGDGSPPQQPPEPKQPSGPNMKFSRSIVSWLLLLGLAMLLVGFLSSSATRTPPLPISEFEKLVQDKNIKRLVIKEDGVVEGLKTGPTEGEAP